MDEKILEFMIKYEQEFNIPLFTFDDLMVGDVVRIIPIDTLVTIEKFFNNGFISENNYFNKVDIDYTIPLMYNYNHRENIYTLVEKCVELNLIKIIRISEEEISFYQNGIIHKVFPSDFITTRKIFSNILRLSKFRKLEI